ncbi:hypothetical protein CIHG_08263 [Coccidioides immitis H538.4]|uniref:Uncharacterized protein n=1 Tax=Coccidioides immitis H538.4 TaxID=396776 RepID=A0A0J8US84_COCIT|nr:hypothetical protein CIHG_08263 [Coccidioides immitis H538.4]
MGQRVGRRGGNPPPGWNRHRGKLRSGAEKKGERAAQPSGLCSDSSWLLAHSLPPSPNSEGHAAHLHDLPLDYGALVPTHTSLIGQLLPPPANRPGQRSRGMMEPTPKKQPDGPSFGTFGHSP